MAISHTIVLGTEPIEIQTTAREISPELEELRASFEKLIGKKVVIVFVDDAEDA